jgi:hypothetical protein
MVADISAELEIRPQQILQAAAAINWVLDAPRHVI